MSKHLDISRSTVQRALTKSGTVEEEVYNRIIDASKELGYNNQTASTKKLWYKDWNYVINLYLYFLP